MHMHRLNTYKPEAEITVVLLHISCLALNLMLCKACDVKEIHLMLDALTQLGLFFKYSPKRSRQLEVAVDEVNQKRCKSDQISKTKISMFCETIPPGSNPPRIPAMPIPPHPLQGTLDRILAGINANTAATADSRSTAGARTAIRFIG